MTFKIVKKYISIDQQLLNKMKNMKKTKQKKQYSETIWGGPHAEN